ncbi:MAG: D-aminoacylase [Rhodothermia bacterium]|nr:MAG: D-aminoacylase [Rhodothermia bacterium]
MTRSNFIRFTLLISLIIAATAQLATARSTTDQETIYSVVISGGTVYDGLGTDGVRTDVGILGNRIAAIGDLSAARAARRIDATGLAVVPGFIDIHSHATSGSPESSGIVQRPLAENYVRQGVTTALGGQDGSSPIQIGEFLAYMDALPSAINVGLFVGHGSIRGRVMGQEDRAPTVSELADMVSLVERAMLDGAFGLSSGLEYTPGSYANLDELIVLAGPLATHNGLYISHIRDEGARVLESISEVIRVGEEAGIAAQVTHHKVIGKARWGGTVATLKLIEEARARGVDVTIDQYPYTASSTGMTILFPGWAKAGGTSELLERLKDPETRNRIRSDVIAHIVEERGADPSTIVAARCPNNSAMDGLSLADILERDRKSITVEGAADVAILLVETGGCSGIFHSMSEGDVRRVMIHPTTMISSDGGIPALGTGVPHPRNYGAFARVLRYYVREEGVLTFQQAIQKMTSLPADRLGLKERGRLEPGVIADVVVLDSEAISDHAVFGDPHQYATGVGYVFVSGRAVLWEGEPTGVRPGKALRHRIE